MEITFPVQHVIRQASVKSVRVLENVCVQIRISLVTRQDQIPFMDQMVELFLPTVLGVVEVLLVLLRRLVHHHILQGEHARNVVVEDMKAPHINMQQHLVLGGRNLITIQVVPHVLIVITKRTTTTIRAQNVEDSDIIDYKLRGCSRHGLGERYGTI